MTKKHFQVLADVLKAEKPKEIGPALTKWLDVVNRIASMCAQFNGQFDRECFLRACGVE